MLTIFHQFKDLSFLLFIILYQQISSVLILSSSYLTSTGIIRHVSNNGLSSFTMSTLNSTASTFKIQVLSFPPNSSNFSTISLYISTSWPLVVTYSEFFAYNTYLRNHYLLNNETAIWQYESNFSIRTYIQVYTNLSVKGVCYGSTKDQYFNLLQNSSMSFVRKCIRVINSFTCSDVFIYIGQIGVKIQYENSRLFVLLYLQATIPTSKLYIYNINLALQKLIMPPVTSALNFQVNNQYIVLYSCPNFYLYNISSDYNFYSSFKISATIIYDVKLTPVTVIVSANFPNKILIQYSLLNGQPISDCTASNSFQQGIKILVNSQSNWSIAWKPFTNQYKLFYFTENYFCNYTDGCYCMVGYCFDVLLLQCYFGGYGLSCVYNPKSTNNCLIYNNNLQYCQKFCHDSCLTCSEDSQKCDQCNLYYENDGQGNCRLNIRMKILVGFVSLLNILRINKLQKLYFFIYDLQLYNYHKTDYDGIIQEILNFLQLIQQEIWNFSIISEYFQWFNTPYPIHSFGYYTNIKFYQVQHRDSQLLQNTKTYFFIYLPSVLIIFFILNRIFYCLFNKKISIFLRLYSMWIYLAFILVNQNIQIITFLAFRHMQNLFSFDVKVRLFQSFSILLIGFFLVISISISPLILYFYGKLSKYFLSNMHRVKGAFLIYSIRFCFQPLISSLIHAIFYEKANVQLVVLSSFLLFTLFFVAGLQLCYGVFETKIFFVCQCLIQLSFIMLNILIYFKYHLELEDQVRELMEEVIRFVMYFYGLILGFQITCAFILLIVQKKQNQEQEIGRRKQIKESSQRKNSRKKQSLAKKQEKLHKVIFQQAQQDQQQENL